MNKTETKQRKPTREEIAACAYDIWQKGGSKPGTDLENWLQAEKQLNHRANAAASQTGLAKTTQKAAADQSITSQSGSTQANYLPRATNVQLQKHLART